MQSCTSVPIQDSTQVGEARRLGLALGEKLGLDETRRGRLGLIINEAGHNILKHGGGGEIILQSLHCGGAAGVEVIALDSGPGMGNISACMRDGFSTSGTQGSGLGALARLGDQFEIHSEVGLGTALVASVWSRDPTVQALRVGVVSVPYPGETVCGDGWGMDVGDARSRFCVIDGLGHGPGALEAAAEGLRTFYANPELGPKALLERMHGDLRQTRGAAAAVAVIDATTGTLSYAGVGNITAFIGGDEKTQNLVSHDGTVGYLTPRFHAYNYAWSESSVLVMHSDGLSTRSGDDQIKKILHREPSLLAALLYRSCKRGRDDATVLVAKRARL